MSKERGGNMLKCVVSGKNDEDKRRELCSALSRAHCPPTSSQQHGTRHSRTKRQVFPTEICEKTAS